MSHLPAVCDPGSTRLPILRACTHFFSALRDSPGCLGAGSVSTQKGMLLEETWNVSRPGQAKMLGMPFLPHGLNLLAGQSQRLVGTGIDPMVSAYFVISG